MLGMLFYGYSTGIFSSRKLEQSSYDSVAMRFVCGNYPADHDSIATFRKRFIEELDDLFVQILLVAQQMGFAKVGNVNIDGTKIQANASRHHAMSYDRIKKLELLLQEEVSKLLELAEQADQDELGLDIPTEIEKREDRLEKLKEAKNVLEHRAKEKYEEEKEVYDKKMLARADQENQTGKKPRGRTPKAPEQVPSKKDQYNFTDPESRIMKTSKGFDQCYNGQAAVNDEMLIVGALSNAHCNDKEELIPTLDKINESLGEVENVAADTGYYSQSNIEQTKSRNIEPYLATGRDKHNQWLGKQLAKDHNEQESGEVLNIKDQMRQKLKTDKGKSIYRKRKMTIEPVFGIIKEIMGFRRFSLRGEQKINGEWTLICSAYNLKRLFNLQLNQGSNLN